MLCIETIKLLSSSRLRTCVRSPMFFNFKRHSSHHKRRNLVLRIFKWAIMFEWQGPTDSPCHGDDPSPDEISILLGSYFKGTGVMKYESQETFVMQNQLFIGNLAFSTTKEDLESAFSVYGAIVEVKIPTDRYTGRVRGFAFVTFESQQSAEKALALDGKELNGRPIRVNVAQEKKSGDAGGGRGGRPGGGGGQGGGGSRGGRPNGGQGGGSRERW
jgi:cold-inducible RNA-binding protein